MKLQQRLSLLAEVPVAAPARSVGPPTKGWRISRWRSTMSLIAMALPGIIVLLVLAYLPMAGLLIAFKNYMPYLGFFGSDWVGFDNFRQPAGVFACTFSFPAEWWSCAHEYR